MTAAVPTIASWLRRPTDDVAHAAYVAVTSLAITAGLAGFPSGPAHALGPISTCAEVALALGGGALVLRLVTFRRLSAAAALVACTTAVVTWLAADRLHAATFGGHLDRHRLALLFEALRSHAVSLDAGLLAAFVVGMGLVATFLRASLVALSYGPRPSGPWAAGLRTPALAALGLLVLVERGGRGDDTARESLPWSSRSEAHAGSTPATDPVRSPFGNEAEERMFATLQRDRASLLAGEITATRRPSIVIVHAESVRFDMLRDDVMPNTLRLSKTCISPSHHYSTSNNTGSSMFGIMTGLPVSYYHLARRENAKPLPLEILKKLGYSISAYYSSYLSTYDGLCDLFFRGLADHIDDERDGTPDVADAAIATRYAAEIAKRDPAIPTFDYIVLESSHYDYAYPPEFEKFTPTATLGFGVRDGIVRRDGIVDELKPRAPFIRNRYQNSILFVDTLIDKIARAWAARRGEVVLIVTGDHGEAFWEHGTFGHGMSLADEQVRVPLVMCLPDANSTRYVYSSHEDILPTVFDFMGLRVPGVPFLAGKSLLRYDAARDVSVFGYGLTGSEYDSRLAVAGDGLKVVYVNRPPFSTVQVYRDGDYEVPEPLSTELEARVADLKLRAVQERVTR
jgi:hypothetical protein